MQQCDKKLLIVTAGAPGSGKSTIVNNIAYQYGLCVVCPDTIRGQLFGDEGCQQDGGRVFRIAYQQMVEALSNDSVLGVIFDATNCRPKARQEILGQANGYYNIAICAVANTDLATCLMRNANRERQVPEDVIERMFSNLQSNWPSTSEGFDYVIELNSLGWAISNILTQ